MAMFMLRLHYWSLLLLWFLRPTLAVDDPRNAEELTAYLTERRKNFCDECMDLTRNPKRRILRPKENGKENGLTTWIRMRLARNPRATPADNERVCSDASVEVSQATILTFRRTVEQAESITDVLNAQIAVKRLDDGPPLVSVSRRPSRVPAEYLKKGKRVQRKNKPSQFTAVVEDVAGKVRKNPLAFAQEMGGKIEETVEKNKPSAAQVGDAVKNVGNNVWAVTGPMLSQPRRMPAGVRA
ncbi:MAG: hypothetical protein M1823_001114 [Watsoniomyces obsoletus]|nr:MAG: hypothetical protein M1823_001114 [Watsoniomyces obsoletus]